MTPPDAMGWAVVLTAAAIPTVLASIRRRHTRA